MSFVGTPKDLVDQIFAKAAEVVTVPPDILPPEADDESESGSVVLGGVKLNFPPPAHPPTPGYEHEENISVVDDDLSFDSTCSLSFDELESFKKKLIGDERLSQIYKLKHNFSERFDNRPYVHPHGATNFDYKAIAEERKKGLEKFKNKVRQENYMYLGQHPEIGALISLFIKKLLTTQPPDPTLYLAEFFSSRMGSSQEIVVQLENEVKRISRYRVNKMKTAGKIWVKSSSKMQSEESGKPTQTEDEGNIMKKLNIGPLAHDFYFDESQMPQKKEAVAEKEQKRKKKGKKKFYCGCKDWKLKKNQGKSNKASEAEDTEEEMPTIGDEEDESEEDLDFEHEYLHDHPEADQIADEIVNMFLNPSGVFSTAGLNE